MAGLNVSCVPRNPELLWLQNETSHRSYQLFTHGVDESLRARRAEAGLTNELQQLELDEGVRRYIHDAGFEGVFLAPMNQLDHSLIKALVERWRPETNTFHFPIGEATVTLEDVQVIWGLPIDGAVVSGVWLSSNDLEYWQQLCLNQLGFIPEDEGHLRGGGEIRIKDLVDQIGVEFDEEDDVACQQKARIVILAMLACYLFVDASTYDISLNFLQNLEDLSIEGRKAWGAAVVANLYRNLTKATLPGRKGIDGPLMLLQYWAWARMPQIAPKVPRVPGYEEYDFSTCYANKWDPSMSHTETPAHVVAVFRSFFCALKNEQFEWTPYVDFVNMLPEACRDGRNIWSYCGSCRNSSGIFRITKWVGSHNCYTDVTNNDNRCLTASMIATEIHSQVKKKLTYSVRHIQAQVKNTWNVDVTYAKAWNARRIAIERLYGTWPSNFDALPRYVAELVRANPDTVVEWDHCPTSSSQIATFKFVFWAFGPAIRAFQRCIPVIFVNGTHLKGSYKGKLLTAVTKNANGQTLPVAFGLVDDESNESWAWFLQNFHTHIGSQRDVDLCVISDRHQGIINAVTNMDRWHHRYCLRHVCSNVMSHFKNRRIKNFTWIVGSTTEASRYTWGVRQIKAEDPAAWVYLKDIGLEKWTLKHDLQRRRWGNLTTNVAESINNVLGLAHMLPIRALINHTFDWTRRHFVDQYRLASTWEPPLARKMWKVFAKRERASTAHTVDVYDERHGLYTVRTNERNGSGEYTYTVTYGQPQKCTCGSWQNHRFPCSHAIAVSGYRREGTSGLASKRYTTRTWQHQYDSTLAPLRDVQYWGEADWRIQGDPAKLVTHRGSVINTIH